MIVEGEERGKQGEERKRKGRRGKVDKKGMGEGGRGSTGMKGNGIRSKASADETRPQTQTDERKGARTVIT